MRQCGDVWQCECGVNVWQCGNAAMRGWCLWPLVDVRGRVWCGVGIDESEVSVSCVVGPVCGNVGALCVFIG